MSDAGDLSVGEMGTDAAKWAAEFRKTALRLGHSDMDEGWLIGWFANAIEHAKDTTSERLSEQAALVPELTVAGLHMLGTLNYERGTAVDIHQAAGRLQAAIDKARADRRGARGGGVDGR